MEMIACIGHYLAMPDTCPSWLMDHHELITNLVNKLDTGNLLKTIKCKRYIYKRGKYMLVHVL